MIVFKPMGLLACLSLVLCTGCGDSGTDGDQTEGSASENPLTAPADYLGAVGNAKQRAVKTIDIASLTQAIQMFQVSEDRLPKDLNELVSTGYIREIPAAPYGQKLVYNATTGQVTVEADPSPNP